MSMRTAAFSNTFGVSKPIVLAPMGGVSGGNLAAAVSAAGGLGLVGASYGNREWMERELEVMRTVRQPWGIGLVMFTVERQMELLDLAISYRPDVIALSFGDPSKFVSRISKAGIKTLVQVHNPEQAQIAMDEGASALIVQGAEAGGHSLVRATLPLVPAVRDAVGEDAVIVAAGGIADGRGMAAVLALGANAAMLGTRFVTATESLLSAPAKAKLSGSSAADTVRTRAFDLVRGIDWPQGYSGRALNNSFTREWIGKEDALLSAPASVRTQYEAAVLNDDLDTRALWAGEAIDLVNDTRSASSIVDLVMQQARDTFTSVSTL